MKLTIANLACRILTLNSEFCKEIGFFGTMSIPEDDPIYKASEKAAYDAWLESNGIDPIKFWRKFEEYIKTNQCREQYNFFYNPAIPSWEQVWEP